MAERTTIFHLIGPPGVGKYTIGKELAAITGARLVDNHAIANVLFNLLDVDGVTPLPPEIWPRVSMVRAAALETVAQLSPRHWSFIFTNFIRGEDLSEEAAFLDMVRVAEARDSVFVPVVLRCATAELQRRIVGDDRRQRLKLVDPVAGARYNEELPGFRTDHPNLLELDVTSISPLEAAHTIVRWAVTRAAQQVI